MILFVIGLLIASISIGVLVTPAHGFLCLGIGLMFVAAIPVIGDWLERATRPPKLS